MTTPTPTASLPPEMLAKATEAAMRDAVKAGLVPKYDDMDSTVKHWFGMTAVVRAALTAADVPGLPAEVERLKAEAAEAQHSLDLQWKASQRAIKAWQEAHPGKENVWPDTAVLELWLMERLDAAEGERDEARAALAKVEAWMADANDGPILREVRRVLGKVEELGKP